MFLQRTVLRQYCFYIAHERVRTKYCDQYVCLSVCLLAYLKNYSAKLHQIFVHVACGCGSVLFWRRCDMWCTFGLWSTSCFHNMRQWAESSTTLWLEEFARLRYNLDVKTTEQFIRMHHRWQSLLSTIYNNVLRCPLGPVAPSWVNCTVSWLTDFTLLPLADDARELYLSGRRNRLTDG